MRSFSCGHRPAVSLVSHFHSTPRCREHPRPRLPLNYLPPGLMKGSPNVLFKWVWGSGFGVFCSVTAITQNTVELHVPQRPPGTDPAASALPCRIRKVWQRRKCAVKNGMLTISHATVSASALARRPGPACRSRGLGASKHVTSQAPDCCPSTSGCRVGQTVSDALFERSWSVFVLWYLSCRVLSLHRNVLPLFSQTKPDRLFLDHLLFGGIWLLVVKTWFVEL